MATYLFPIKTAILTFPFLALLIALPFLIWQYRRYGGLSTWRGITIYSFVFYLLCAYFLIILPLPKIADVAKLTTQRYNLVPFTAWREFWLTTVFKPRDPGTWSRAIRQPGFIQPVFNVVLTIPFGVYLRYYFKQSFPKIILWGFGLSLFFELTQLSGLYGIYPRPYRLFDVDDLILNTTGALIGAVITPLLVMAFPSREEMDAKSIAKGRRVTFTRRLVAWLIDFVICQPLISGLFAGLFALLGWQWASKNHILLYSLSCLLIFLVVPAWKHGETLGKKIVKIEIVAADQQPVKFGWLLLRQLLLYGIAIPSFVETNYLIVQIFSKMHQSQANLLLLGVSGLISVFIGINFVWGLFFRQGRFFYDDWAKTIQISLTQPATTETTSAAEKSESSAD